MPTHKVLSIEAWNSPEGWTHNQTFDTRNDIALPLGDDGYPSPRVVLKELRRIGALSPSSAGKCRVEFQDELVIDEQGGCQDSYNVEVLARSNNEPLLLLQPIYQPQQE